MAVGLQVPSKIDETQTKLTRKKQNSRMMDVPGGEPGSVILANSRKRVVYLIASMHIRGVGKNHPNQRHDADNARHDD